MADMIERLDRWTLQRARQLDPEVGDPCPERGCSGEMGFHPVQGCYCHVSPPCGACVGNPLVCLTCGWEPEPVPDPPAPAFKPIEWTPPKRDKDLGNGKRVFDWTMDSRSGSTMEYEGRYEGPVTPEDIIELFGDGTFGHRGPSMWAGRFRYTLITD